MCLWLVDDDDDDDDDADDDADDDENVAAPGGVQVRAGMCDDIVCG